jgi:hypothetical protein
MRQACAGKTKFKECGYCSDWMNMTEARSNKEYQKLVLEKELIKDIINQTGRK